MTAHADRQKEFCSYFMPAYPMRSAAAIGGNATQENLCQPVTTGAKDHGSDGVLQWRLDRLAGRDGLQPWCAAQGIPWDTLKSQALFTMHELDQPQHAVLKADLKAGAKSLETLTINFCDAFERPSAAGREPDKRIGYARDCLSILMRDAPVIVAAAQSVRHMTRDEQRAYGGLQAYIIERDTMLRKLDPEACTAHFKKWSIPMPPMGWADPVEVPMIMMHKCRLTLTTFSEAEKAISREWLSARGYSEDLE
jgi:hypothetical protein